MSLIKKPLKKDLAKRFEKLSPCLMKFAMNTPDSVDYPRSARISSLQRFSFKHFSVTKTHLFPTFFAEAVKKATTGRSVRPPALSTDFSKKKQIFSSDQTRPSTISTTMNRLPLLLALLMSCLLLSSCGTLFKKGKWMDERAEARAVGGSTWSDFVIDNLFYMNSYLSYDQQMRDVQSAIPYASPADKKFLAGVKQRMARDKVASAQRKAAAEARRRQKYSTPSSPSSYGSSSSGSTYSSSGSNAVENARRRQDRRDFDNALKSIEYGTATRPGNPYAD